MVHITQAATGADLQQGRGEEEEQEENIHRHSDRCMLGWSDMLAGRLKLEKAHSSYLSWEFEKLLFEKSAYQKGGIDLRVQEPEQEQEQEEEQEQEQEHATKHPRVTKVLPEKMSFSFITLRSLLDLLTAALSMICSGL